MRSFALLTLLVGAITIGASAGCATAPRCAENASLGFAVTTTSTREPVGPHVTNLRVLSTQVNMRKPVLLTTSGDDVTITFALRGREGVTFAVDPESLEVHKVDIAEYRESELGAMPAYMKYEPTIASLGDGRTVSCWTEEGSSRVLAQVSEADGASRREPFVVLAPGKTVLGSPRATSVDGRHVIVAFFASSGEGFELIAASVEIPQ